MELVGAVSSAVAAVAALAALVFAYLTVRQGLRNQTDAAEAHAEQMDQRRQALAAELRLARIQQLERIAEVMVDVAAKSEAFANFQPVLFPAMIARLGAAQAGLDALDGPNLPGVRSIRESASPRGDVANLVQSLSNCLNEIERALKDLGMSEAAVT